MEMKTFTAGADDDDRRIDRVIRRLLPNIPLSAVYSAMRRKRILLNGRKTSPSTRVREGDLLSVAPALLDGLERRNHPRVPLSSLPEILFESNTVIAVQKPRDISVHGKHSIENMLHAYLLPKITTSLSFKPGPLHRLDRDTTGLLFFSKNLAGARRFSELLRKGKTGKFYIALVIGRISSGMTLRSPVGDKRALSILYPLISKEEYSLVLVRIVTGRKHQIRTQAADAGYPLFGDEAYGGGRTPDGYLLHAYALVLQQFDTLLEFKECRAPLPPESMSRIERIFGKNSVEQALKLAEEHIRPGFSATG